LKCLFYKVTRFIQNHPDLEKNYDAIIISVGFHHCCSYPWQGHKMNLENLKKIVPQNVIMRNLWYIKYVSEDDDQGKCFQKWKKDLNNIFEKEFGVMETDWGYQVIGPSCKQKLKIKNMKMFFKNLIIFLKKNWGNGDKLVGHHKVYLFFMFCKKTKYR